MRALARTSGMQVGFISNAHSDHEDSDCSLGWQTRVIETVLMNTFQIFDDDD